MKRSFLTVSDGNAAHRLAAVIGLGCVVFCAPAARAQTVDEVIAKNIQAHGGMAKLKSVDTRRSSGKVLFGSIQATIIQINKRPDRVREETSLQGMSAVQVYNGKGAWQIDPFEGRKDPMLMSEDDAKGLVIDADMDGPLVDYKQKGSKAELLGHDAVEGTDCYKVKLTLKDGDIFTYYLDADSFLELKLETKMTIRGAIQENDTYYGDYEEVDGIYYPFALETAPKGESHRQKTTVDKLEINLPVADSVFVMPVAKTASTAPGASR